MTLPWARMLLRTIGRRSFHTSKCTSLFHEFPDKDGYLKKTEEEKAFRKLPLKERLHLEFNLYKQGCIESFTEFKEQFQRGPAVFMHEHEVDVFWRFTGQKEELREWIVTTDKDNNLGFSTAQ